MFEVLLIRFLIFVLLVSVLAWSCLNTFICGICGSVFVRVCFVAIFNLEHGRSRAAGGAEIHREWKKRC